MRIFKKHPLDSLVNGYLVDSPKPSKISYLWNFGVLLWLWLLTITYIACILAEYGQVIGGTSLSLNLPSIDTGFTLYSRLGMFVIIAYGLPVYVILAMSDASFTYTLFKSRQFQILFFVIAWWIVMNKAYLDIGVCNAIFLRVLLLFWYVNSFYYCVNKKFMSPLTFIKTFSITLIISAVSIFLILPLLLLFTDFDTMIQVCSKVILPSKLNTPCSVNLSGSLDLKSTCVDVSYNSKVSGTIWTDLFGNGQISKEGAILNSKKFSLILTDKNVNILQSTLSKELTIPLATGEFQRKEFIWYVYLTSKTHVLALPDQIKLAQELHRTPYPSNLDLNPLSYMEHLFLAEGWLNCSPHFKTTLEKALAYIDNPSKDLREYQEQYSAYMARKNRYIGHVLSANWKGRPIDFTLNSIVRAVIREDLYSAITSQFLCIDKLLSLDPYYNFTPLSVSRDIYHPLSYHPCFMLNVNHNEIVLKLRMGNIMDKDYKLQDWCLKSELDFSNSIADFSQEQVQGYIWAKQLEMSTWPREESHVD